MRFLGSALLVFILCFVALLCTLTAVVIQLLPLFSLAVVVAATAKALERRARSPHRYDGHPGVQRFSTATAVSRQPVPPSGGWIYLPVWVEDDRLSSPRYVDAFMIEGPKDG